MLDWMTALRMPLVLVAGSYLGTISHTLSALDVVKRRTLDVAAVVVSETPGSSVDLTETIETTARFSRETRIVPVRRRGEPFRTPELERLATELWSGGDHRGPLKLKIGQ